jgi:hypothetical protein
MSDTPRTDAECQHREGLGLDSCEVSADFASELERELAQRTAALDQMTVHRNAAIEHRDITQQVLNGITVALSQRTADLAKANAERDEARREACQLEVNWNFVCSQMNEKRFRKLTLDPNAVAVERGWDCFDVKEGKS